MHAVSRGRLAKCSALCPRTVQSKGRYDGQQSTCVSTAARAWTFCASGTFRTQRGSEPRTPVTQPGASGWCVRDHCVAVTCTARIGGLGSLRSQPRCDGDAGRATARPATERREASHAPDCSRTHHMRGRLDAPSQRRRQGGDHLETPGGATHRAHSPRRRGQSQKHFRPADAFHELSRSRSFRRHPYPRPLRASANRVRVQRLHRHRYCNP